MKNSPSAKVLKWQSSRDKLYLCGNFVEHVRFFAPYYYSADRYAFSGELDEQLHHRKEWVSAAVDSIEKIGYIEDSIIQAYIEVGWRGELLPSVAKEITRRANRTKRPPKSSEQKRLENLRRAKASIRRISATNGFCVMWTFTFSPVLLQWMSPEHVITATEQRDCKQVNKYWNCFLTRLRSHIGRFSFVKVLERHAGSDTHESKIDTFHIHLACSFLMDKYVMQAIWGYGNVHYDDFRYDKQGKRRGSVKNPGLYISKYIDKDFGNLENGMRNYSVSTTTKRPKIIRNEGAVKNILRDEIDKHYVETMRIETFQEGLYPLTWTQYKKPCPYNPTFFKIFSPNILTRAKEVEAFSKRSKPQATP